MKTFGFYLVGLLTVVVAVCVIALMVLPALQANAAGLDTLLSVFGVL